MTSVHDWAGVVGAVVGRDDAAIRTGMQSTLATAGNYEEFFRRVQLEDVPIQTATLLMRQCMVPAINYHLRCVAPTCIEDVARRFDERMMEATMDKLGLSGSERNERTVELLQRKLRDGGWGLAAAERTSPAAYLGSLAACHAEPSFTPYWDSALLPATSQLYGWVDDAMRRVRVVDLGDAYQTDIEPLLPVTASTFFSHYSTADSSVTATLQRSLSAKANSHLVEAAVQRMKELSR